MSAPTTDVLEDQELDVGRAEIPDPEPPVEGAGGDSSPPPAPPTDDPGRGRGRGGKPPRHRWKRLLLYTIVVIVAWCIGYFLVGPGLARIALNVERRWED